MQPSVNVCFLVLVLFWTLVAGDPSRFKFTTCAQHPTSAMGNHKSPLADNAMTFTVTDSKGATTNTLCPGTYTVKVKFSNSREALVTASQGSLGASGSCPNRKQFNSATNQPTMTLTVPCGLSGSVVLFVTSATGQTANFQQSSASLTIDSACSACSPPPSTAAHPPPAATGSPATTAASSPPPASSSSSSSSPPPPAGATTSPVDEDNDNTDSDDTSPSPSSGSPAASPSGCPPVANTAPTTLAGCTASSLGYQCSKPLGKGAVLHYSYTAERPSNPCTTGKASLDALSCPTAATAGTPLLHLALESPLPGYAALAFARKAGHMTPADAVIGYFDEMNGAPSVEAYAIDGYSVAPLDTAVAPGESWALNRGIVKTSGGTVLCFSVRDTDLPAAAAGRRMMLQAPTTAPQFDPSGLQLNWAVNDQSTFSTHRSQGGAVVNAVTGTSTSGGLSSKERFIIIHGALLAAAWALLLPAGTLFARHRFIFKDRVASCGPLNKQVWYYFHMFCQLTGLSIFLAGFIIGAMELDATEGSARSVGVAHAVLGYMVMGFAGLQFIGAFIRPAPGAPRRPAWNFFHHTVGRLAILIAWVAVFLGIYLYHERFGASLGVWLGPVLGSIGVLLVVQELLKALGAADKAKQNSVAPSRMQSQGVDDDPKGKGRQAAAQTTPPAGMDIDGTHQFSNYTSDSDSRYPAHSGYPANSEYPAHNR